MPILELNVFVSPLNVFPTFIRANELVCKLVTKLLVCVFCTNELVCKLVTKLLVCVFCTNELVAEFGTYPNILPLKEPVNDVALTPPITSNLFVGVDVPIPTFPVVFPTTILSTQELAVLYVLKCILPSAATPGIAEPYQTPFVGVVSIQISTPPLPPIKVNGALDPVAVISTV